MTYTRREEIFSKDIISIDELAELLNTSYQEAAKIMRNIKRRFDRYPHQGKLHVEDYKEFFGISHDNPRYFKKNEGGSGNVYA